MLAYALRFHPAFTEIRPVIFQLSLDRYVALLSAVAFVWIGVFAVAGLYTIRPSSLFRELVRVLFASAAAMGVVFSLLFFSRSLFESRFIALAGWLLALLAVWISRIAIRLAQRAFLALGIGQQRVVVIGRTKGGETLVETFRNRPSLGYAVTATFPVFDKRVQRRILELKRAGQADEILLADPNVSRGTTLDLLAFTDTEHLRLRYTADLFAAAVGRTDVATYAGIPVIELKKTPLDGWGAIYKRAFDVVAAVVLLVLTSPMTLLTTLVIACESGRPILFRNVRVGEGGRHFDTLKFRSMRQEHSIGGQKGFGDQDKALALEEELIRQSSRKQGPVCKIMDDPRITPFGHFIRKYSVDELPQLLNVLAGSMSLVGPRPHQPREVAQYAAKHLKVHAIKPGITGLAQISGRSDLTFEEEHRLDLYYIEHWSPWLDLYILWKTPFAVLFRKGAY